MDCNYFDHAATTQTHPLVIEAVTRAMAEVGNPHSIHNPGRAAHQQVEEAREWVARLVGAEDPQQIVFTSGATEANNALTKLPGTLWRSPFEHSSLRELPCQVLPNEGWRLLPAGQTPDTLTVMAVNNETGAVIDHPRTGTHNHSDLTQAVGKLPIDLAGLHSASLSGHKFGGPMGVGVLYLADPYDFPAWQIGGGQENGLRAGTLNVPGIVGLGVAARLACEADPEEERKRIEELRGIVLETLAPLNPATNDAPHQSPWILSVWFEEVLAESLVIEADARGFALSSGAACSSRSTEPSPVLVALGLDLAQVRGTIRISFGPSNTPDSARNLGLTLVESVERLRGSGAKR